MGVISKPNAMIIKCVSNWWDIDEDLGQHRCQAHMDDIAKCLSGCEIKAKSNDHRMLIKLAGYC